MQQQQRQASDLELNASFAILASFLYSRLSPIPVTVPTDDTCWSYAHHVSRCALIHTVLYGFPLRRLEQLSCSEEWDNKQRRQSPRRIAVDLLHNYDVFTTLLCRATL